MKRLAVLLAALGLVLVGCHGTNQTSTDMWLIYNGYCGDNTATIRLYQPDPGASYISGTTGRFTTPNNCASPAGANAGWVREASSLVKSTGLCWSGIGWSFNSQGGYSAGQTLNIGTRICNDGYYWAHTDSGIFFDDIEAWKYDTNGPGLNSPTDYVCYHNPCQG